MAKDRQSIEEQVRRICEDPVHAAGFELLLVEWTHQQGRALLRLYLDRPSGDVTIGDCTQVARLLGPILDAHDPIPGAFSLEVSSPGLDRPLVRIEHFERFVGREVKVRLKPRPEGGRRNWKGRILRVDGDAVVLLVDGQEQTLRIVDMERANLVPEL